MLKLHILTVFTPSIKMCLGGSDHKWSALSPGVNEPETYWGHTWDLICQRPHSEVIWVAHDHILLAVCTWTCPGSHRRTRRSTSTHSFTTHIIFKCEIKKKKQQQRGTSILVDGVQMKQFDFNLSWRGLILPTPRSLQTCSSFNFPQTRLDGKCITASCQLKQPIQSLQMEMMYSTYTFIRISSRGKWELFTILYIFLLLCSNAFNSSPSPFCSCWIKC